MSRSERVVLGDVHEAPIPAVGVQDLRQALSLCDCQGVARNGELSVKVSQRALRGIEKTCSAVAPLSCAGALLGTIYQVGENWLVDVQEVLPFQATPEMHRVRVPRHAWQEMLQRRHDRFPDMRVIGWFHSHPGLGASFSDADAFVQRYFFPADWQVACVMDPMRRETRFFSRRGRNVLPLGAYWVERDGVAEEPEPAQTSQSSVLEMNGGKQPMMRQPEIIDVPQQSSETYLKERFVERSLEKILRLLQEPPLNMRDYVMMGCMAVLVILLFVTRGHSNSAELHDVAQKLDRIAQRLDAMTPSAAAAGVAAPRPAAPAASSSTAPQARPSTVAATRPSAAVDGPAEQKAPAEGQPDVDHIMQPGETLWSVADQYYGKGALMNALLKYNKVADARDMRAGMTIKVPSAGKLSTVTASAPTAAHHTVSGPTPTPH